MWLGVLTPDGPRDAGDLCDRHAAAMTPPHGWELEDRRGTSAVAAAVATENPPARRARRATAAQSGARRAAVTAAAPKVRKRRARAPRDDATAPLPFDAPEAVGEEGLKWERTVAAATIPVEDVGSLRVAGSAVAATEADGSRPAAVTAATAATTRVDASAVVADTGAGGLAEETAVEERWAPRFDRDDDLDGLLDAKTPLLGRAFRNIRSV